MTKEVEDALRRMRESAKADFVWFQRRIYSLLDGGLRRIRKTRAATLGYPYEVLVRKAGVEAGRGWA